VRRARPGCPGHGDPALPSAVEKWHGGRTAPRIRGVDDPGSVGPVGFEPGTYGFRRAMHGAPQKTP